MAKQAKSKYAGVGGARTQRAANYFKPGTHALWRISRIEEGEDRFKTALVAANGTLIFAFEDNSGNRTGEEVSEVIKRSNVAFEGRLKALAMAAGDLTETDFDQQEYDGEIFDDMVAEENPVGGTVVEVRAVSVVKQTAANKKPEDLEAKDRYTRVDFVRRVPFSEVQEVMLAGGIEQDKIDRLIPGIAEEIAAESEVPE